MGVARLSRASRAGRNVLGDRWRQDKPVRVNGQDDEVEGMKKDVSKLKAGEWVEIRSKEEILRTLDARAQLDGMPFMPEMLAFCGKRFKVYKRAHKTCDTVFPIRSRRVDRAAHLETRCDGSSDGGCQAGCLIFWKNDWLRRVGVDEPERAASSSHMAAPNASSSGGSVNERLVHHCAQKQDESDSTPTYVCQATQLPSATSQLQWWDLRQYVEDYRSGNVTLWRMGKGLIYSAFYHLSQTGIGLGRPMRWFYDTLHVLWKGTLFPHKCGEIPEGNPTPAESLNLQCGELVRVKAHEAILRTITRDNKNRGLYWDAELVPYCGGTYRVLKRVTRIIDEKTGKMLEMKTPSIILDSVVCQARYSACRMFCPRSIYSYWREIWLERVNANAP